jgi:hypothetical protein
MAEIRNLPDQGSNIEFEDPDGAEVRQSIAKRPVNPDPPDSSQFAESLESQIAEHNTPRLALNLPAPGLGLGIYGTNDALEMSPLSTRRETQAESRDGLLPAMGNSWQTQIANRALYNSRLRQFRQNIAAVQVSAEQQAPQLSLTDIMSSQGRMTASLEELSAALDNIYPSAQSAVSEIEAQPGPSRIPLQNTGDRQRDIAQGLKALSDGLDKLSRAWEARSLAANDHSAGPSAHGHHHHHDGGGAIIVDLDEAVHGVYAAIGYLVQSFKGGSGGVAQQFRDNANLLVQNPSGWITDSEAPHGATDFGISAGIAGVLLPLAILAIKAGVEEMHGAAHTGKELRDKIKNLETNIEGLARSGLLNNSQAPREIARLADQVDRERLTAMRFLAKQNKADAGIGFFSAGAGGAILAKASAEIAEKAAYIATGASHAATLATEGVGFASTFALGPVAAAASTGLAGYALQKSLRKRDAFRNERESTETRIGQLLGGQVASQAVTAYHAFLSAKLEQHDKFFSSYTNWSKGFLGGSTLYTASTTAKMGVAIAAFAGASALSHGAVPAALLAGVTAGGVIMGASSQHFLTGHGRQQRYQGYYKDDDPELDRNFLASIDLLGNAGSSADPLRGLKLRSDFFSQISSREDQRQTFLTEVANATGKRFDDKYTYTADPEDVVRRRGPKPTPKEVVQSAAQRATADSFGRLRAAGQFATQTLKSGSISSAKASAQKEWNDSRAYLTKSSLKDWLSESQNTAAQIEVMKSMLDTQLDFLEKKVDAKADAYKVASGELNSLRVDSDVEGPVPEQNATRIQQGNELKRMLVNLDRDLERDQTQLAQALKLRISLQTLSGGTSNAIDEDQLALAITQFMKIQSGETYDSHADPPNIGTARDKFAEYLMKDAPKRYRDLRGKLIETELQSARLRDQMSTQPHGVDEPAPGTVTS